MTRMPPRDFAFWAKSQAAIVFVIFLDFHSTKHELPHWLILGLMAFTDRDTFGQLYPARDTLQHVIKACWKVARQKAGKHSASFFFFFFFFFVNEHNNTKMKPQTKNQRFLKLLQKRNSSCWTKTMQVI